VEDGQVLTPKLLILNDSDPWMQRKIDIRSWAAHGLWFAEEGDVVLTLDVLDDQFVRHVCAVKGIDPAGLVILPMPTGRFGAAMFDGPALVADTALLDKVRLLARERGISRAEALWMTPETSLFIHQAGVEGGAGTADVSLMLANGYEFFNSKYTFHVLCKTLPVRLPRATVAFDRAGAVAGATEFLGRDDAPEALMCKRAHGGAGGANHLLFTDEWAAVSEPLAAGARRQTAISSQGSAGRAEEIAGFWDDNWDFLSNEGRFPVIVEEAIPRQRTYYVEQRLESDGPRNPVVGELLFSDGGLDLEICPVRDLDDQLRVQLESTAAHVANRYWLLGYRGVLSVDMIVPLDGGDVAVTEVNARYTGSTHLHEIMTALPALSGTAHPRVALQFQAPPSGGPDTLAWYLEALSRNDLLYTPDRGSGVVVLTPPLGADARGPVLTVAVAEHVAQCEALMGKVLGLGQGNP
jgi:hypothetical protein